MTTTNDILKNALYAGAAATDEIAPGQGKHMRKFADELHPESKADLTAPTSGLFFCSACGGTTKHGAKCWAAATADLVAKYATVTEPTIWHSLGRPCGAVANEAEGITEIPGHINCPICLARLVESEGA